MKLYPIRSGSKGNAVLVYTEKTKILVDCGISGKVAESGIRKIGIEPSEISAILVTHEHNDHIKGVGVMTRRYNIPVYANESTWIAMEGALGKINEDNKKVFINKNSFKIGDIEANSFEIPHDAADPVGYCFESGNRKISVATDIGVLKEDIFRAIKGSNAVLMEANHDINMLEVGSYPFSLKQRIRGEKGHLSNDEAGLAAKYLYKMGTRSIILGHLSPENNYPLLAKQTVMNILNDDGNKKDDEFKLSVALGNEESLITAV